ncbi:MAG TPA: hypothetical protein VNT03_14220 [Baekduia sp.]|nr:hypothetical protein [Baekduia sp.]
MSAQANLRMKRVAALSAQGTRVRALSLTAERVAVLSVAAVSILLVVLTWNRWGDVWLDSGYDLVAAAKVSHANAPYIDFDYTYGPLGPLLLGAVFEVLGISIGASVAFGLVVASAVVGLSYAVARTLVGPSTAACVGVLTAVPAFSNSNVSFVQPHAYGATLGVLLILAGLLVIARFASGGDRRLLPVLGLITGLTALTRHECFGAMALAVGVWSLVRIARSGARRRELADMAIVVGSAAAVGFAGYGAFLVAAQVHGTLTLDQLLHENLFPRGLLRDSVAVVFKTLAPGTAQSFVNLLAVTLGYAAGVAVLLGLARAIDAGGRRRQAAIALCVMALVVGAIVLLARPDTVRFYLKYAFAWIPAGACLAAALLVWRGVRRRGAAWGAADQIAMLVSLLLVGLSYSVYARYWPYPNPDYPQETAYGMAVVATFLAWLHLRELPALRVASPRTVRALGTGWIAALAVICAALLIHDARDEPFSVKGTGGTMHTTAVDGPTLQKAVDLIQAQTRRSEPVLLAPQMTSLYVMTGRQDPLPQLSLLPGALDGPAAEDAAIRTLDNSGVRLAIIDRTPLTRYDAGSFGIGYDRRIGAWLRRNFTHTTTLRGTPAGGAEPRILDVWLRRTL